VRCDHGDFYCAPSFQFHPGDFLEDTQDLDTLEIGAYWLLILHAWKHFGIPGDLSRIAKIVNLTPRQTASIWPELKGYWRAHPLGCDCLINPGLEKRRDYAAGKSGAGKMGGRPPSSALHLDNANGKQTESTTHANGKQNESITQSKRKANRNPSIAITSPFGSSLRSESSGAASAAAAADALPPWQDGVREAARAISKRKLRELTASEEWLTLGRYHALEFANCTKTEGHNKRHGTKIAGAFAAMSRSERYGDLTVAQYVGFARKVHENREAAPWFDPWMIKGVVEIAA
jgi:uncharacterized protein YdaU (DUF1376 family)